MPRPAIVFRILVSSPSDTEEERKIIPDVLRDWNISNALFRGIYLEPVLFETHSTPLFGDRPQSIINKQLMKSCDILISLFWTRLGNPTEQAESRTLEEINEFRQDKKPVLLYFSSLPIIPERIDMEQYKKLLEYRENAKKEGLMYIYKSMDDLRNQIQKDISLTIDSIYTKYGHLIDTG